MLLVSIAASTALYTEWILTGRTGTIDSSVLILVKVIVPFCVLVVNVVAVREVRRASNHAAVNLGLQQHHHSTSSNSAVPTVMLVTTSLVYLLLCSASSITYAVGFWTPKDALSPATWDVVDKVSKVSMAAHNLVFAYNFYVYLVTGKQFRSELHKLFCRRCAAEAADAARLSRRSAQTTV